MLTEADLAQIRQALRAELDDREALARGIPVDYATLRVGEWVKDRRSDGTITFELTSKDEERDWWLGEVVEATGAYKGHSSGFSVGTHRDVTFVDAVVVRRAS